MPTPPLDPAPRSYTASVTLLRRSDRGAAVAPAHTTIDEIESWLLADAMQADDLLELFEALAWRLVAAGAPLDRASLHVGTLHPQVFGFAWNWERADGLCDEVKVAEATLKTERLPAQSAVSRDRVRRSFSRRHK
jgi:adenylate cyclase